MADFIPYFVPISLSHGTTDIRADEGLLFARRAEPELLAEGAGALLQAGGERGAQRQGVLQTGGVQRESMPEAVEMRGEGRSMLHRYQKEPKLDS